jgi:hypothetical protein
MPLRENRLVENEKLFKRMNERLEEAVEASVPADERIPFLCECADRDCLGRVGLTLAEFSVVRSHDDRFLILPGHKLAEGEEVVEEHDRFHVTQKAHR